MPQGYQQLAPSGNPILDQASSVEQSIQGLAERGRTVRMQTASFSPNQTFAASAKWTNVLPAVVVTIDAFDPNAPFGQGNPFIFWEMSFEYFLTHASSGGIGGSGVVKDSVELPAPAVTQDGMMTFSHTGGAWWPVRLENTTAWQATAGSHVIQLAVTAGAGWTLTIRNVFIEAGVL
jgi:hypothetical protein